MLVSRPPVRCRAGAGARLGFRCARRPRFRLSARTGAGGIRSGRGPAPSRRAPGRDSAGRAGCRGRSGLAAAVPGLRRRRVRLGRAWPTPESGAIAAWHPRRIHPSMSGDPRSTGAPEVGLGVRPIHRPRARRPRPALGRPVGGEACGLMEQPRVGRPLRRRLPRSPPDGVPISLGPRRKVWVAWVPGINPAERTEGLGGRAGNRVEESDVDLGRRQRTVVRRQSVGVQQGRNHPNVPAVGPGRGLTHRPSAVPESYALGVAHGAPPRV